MFFFFCTCSVCNGGQNRLYRKELVVSAYSGKPFLTLNKTAGEFKGGVALHILRTLSRHFGFRWTPKVADNWAIFYENGSVGGSLGEVRGGGG